MTTLPVSVRASRERTRPALRPGRGGVPGPPSAAAGGTSVRRPVRVAICSASAVTRHGLAVVLSRAATRMLVVPGDPVRGAHVDVVLVDTVSWGSGAVPRLEACSAAGVDAVAVGWESAAEDSGRWARHGARGFVSLRVGTEELLTSIEALTRPDARARASTPGSALSSALTAAGLNPRETEVFTLICCGLSNSEISAELCLSANTIKTYVRLAYRKLGITRRTQAVIWGVRHGLETERAALGTTEELHHG